MKRDADASADATPIAQYLADLSRHLWLCGDAQQRMVKELRASLERLETSHGRPFGSSAEIANTVEPVHALAVRLNASISWRMDQCEMAADDPALVTKDPNPHAAVDSSPITVYLGELARHLWLRRDIKRAMMDELRGHLETLQSERGMPFSTSEEIASSFGAVRPLAARLNASVSWHHCRAPWWLLGITPLFLVVLVLVVVLLRMITPTGGPVWFRVPIEGVDAFMVTTLFIAGPAVVVLTARALGVRAVLAVAAAIAPMVMCDREVIALVLLQTMAMVVISTPRPSHAMTRRPFLLALSTICVMELPHVIGGAVHFTPTIAIRIIGTGLALWMACVLVRKLADRQWRASFLESSPPSRPSPAG